MILLSPIDCVVTLPAIVINGFDQRYCSPRVSLVPRLGFQNLFGVLCTAR